jgi:hypothetical protein
MFSNQWDRMSTEDARRGGMAEVRRATGRSRFKVEKLIELGAPVVHKPTVLSAFAPASIACAELKPAGGQAASRMPSTATVFRRRSSLRRSAGTCW